MGVALDRPLVSVDEARRILASTGTPVTRTERIPLLERLDASCPRRSPRRWMSRRSPGRRWTDMPLCSADTASASPDAPATLRIAGRAYAGEPWPGRLERGTAVCDRHGRAGARWRERCRDDRRHAPRR